MLEMGSTIKHNTFFSKVSSVIHCPLERFKLIRNNVGRHTYFFPFFLNPDNLSLAGYPDIMVGINVFEEKAEINLLAGGKAFFRFEEYSRAAEVQRYTFA
jgi:hypothetical protein